MTIVLIYGGGCSAAQWSRVIPLLDGPALAVDLPGRRAKPGDHAQANFTDWSKSVLSDLDAAGIGSAVLVGHSLAGGTMLTLARLAPERIRAMAFVAAAVPNDRGMIIDMLAPEARAFLGDLHASGAASIPAPPPKDAEGGKELVDYMVEDSLLPFFEPLALDGLRGGIPCTYVKLTRDKTIPPELQQIMADIVAKEAGCDLVELETGHLGMLTHPGLLADTLNEVAAR